MNYRAYSNWLTASFDFWVLAAEASSVPTLRIAHMAAGGSVAAAEAELMVREKVDAAIELQTRLVTGEMGFTPLSGVQATLRHYRRKVAANDRRLRRLRG